MFPLIWLSTFRPPPTTCWPGSQVAVAPAIPPAGAVPPAVLYVILSIAAELLAWPAPSATAAAGTLARVLSFTSAPVRESRATFEPFTALLLIFERTTAFFLSCLGPTLLAGSAVAAYAPPLRAM